VYPLGLRVVVCRDLGTNSLLIRGFSSEAKVSLDARLSLQLEGSLDRFDPVLHPRPRNLLFRRPISGNQDIAAVRRCYKRYLQVTGVTRELLSQESQLFGIDSIFLEICCTQKSKRYTFYQPNISDLRGE